MPNFKNDNLADNSLFFNEENLPQYNPNCCLCRNKCKQSFRVTLLCCPQYCPFTAPQESPEHAAA